MTRIIITGNPGVGKHTIGSAIAKKLNYPIIDLNKFVILNNTILKSTQGDSLDVDVKTASIVLKKELNNRDNLIIIGHLAPYLLRSNQIDFAAILRRHPKQLLQVYNKRKYVMSKIKDNITCEILGVCSYDVLRRFGRTKIGEFDTSITNIPKTVKNIIAAVKSESIRNFGMIDWLSKIENEREIIDLILFDHNQVC